MKGLRIRSEVDIPSRVKIEVNGINNELVIQKSAVLGDLYIRFNGDGNRIVIGERSKIIGRLLVENKSQITIGSNTTFERVAVLAGEGGCVEIGEGCMFSYGITVRNSDAHSIMEGGKRTNYAKDIYVGHRVWVGAEVIILKGVEVANNSIIGVRSVVTKKFPIEGSSIVGIPAKVNKTGLSWSRKLLE